MEQLFKKLERKLNEYLQQEEKSITFETTFKNDKCYLRCSIVPELVRIDFDKMALYIEDILNSVININNIIDIKEDLSEMLWESYILETKDNYFRLDFI